MIERSFTGEFLPSEMLNILQTSNTTIHHNYTFVFIYGNFLYKLQHSDILSHYNNRVNELYYLCFRSGLQRATPFTEAK